MSSSSVLIICLDGVDFQYLDRFADSLPNIRRCRETGIEASLRSTHPPWTGSAWPSMFTGVDPSHHGVYDFFQHRGTYPNDADAVTRRDVQAPAIWDYLTELERRCVVVNVPITHPAEELEGVLIPGYLAPADEDGYPPGIREELSEVLGRDYEIYSEYETAPESSKKIDGYESLIRDRTQSAEHLLETESWDLAFVQVQKTDAVFHNSSSEADFKRIYEAADDLVGRLVDASGDETNVILCSDHGMGSVAGYKIYINEILKANGFIETTTAETTQQSISDAKGTIAGEEDGHSAVSRMIGGVFQRLGVSPATVYHSAKRLGVEQFLVRITPRSFRRSLAQNIDWRQSVAYCRRASEQGIRINVEGRDPNGVVPQDQYEDVRDEIIELLSDLETDDGEPVFEFVRKREEIYDGPYTEDACDVVFRTTNMNHSIAPKLYGRHMIPVDTYDHKSTGIFVASGPDINSSWSPHELSLLDVAPIVFALLDEAIPERMLGTVPDGLMPGSIEYREYDTFHVDEDDGYSQDQTEVTERLSDLGYL